MPYIFAGQISQRQQDCSKHRAQQDQSQTLPRAEPARNRLDAERPLGRQMKHRFLRLGKVDVRPGTGDHFLVPVLRFHTPELVIISFGVQLIQTDLPQHIIPIQRHGHLSQISALLHNRL